MKEFPTAALAFPGLETIGNIDPPPPYAMTFVGSGSVVANVATHPTSIIPPGAIAPL